MSEFKGHLGCPRCGKGKFHMEDWDTYVSVTCLGCGYKMGEADPAKFAGMPVWNYSPETGWHSRPLGGTTPAGEDDTTREPGAPAVQVSEAPPAPDSGAGDESRPASSPTGAASSRGAWEPPPPAGGEEQSWDGYARQFIDAGGEIE